MKNENLWQKLKAYNFPKGFDDKLSDEFRLKDGQVQQLKEEYLRFVYLAQLSQSEATPSREIDRVWHLHLSYTRDYWEEFCPNVLGQSFHHDPCEDLDSMPRYQSQYAGTIALYETEFGETPPLKIWPTGTTWKRVWLGIVIAVVGVLSGFILRLNMPEALALLIVPALMFVGGVIIAMFNVPYEFRIRATAQGGGGFGGGGSAGCGGGGCGGGGG